MKINLERISVTDHHEFILDGYVWTEENKTKNQGTSAKGLWTDFENSKGEKARIYKSDLLKINKLAAIKLFN